MTSSVTFYDSPEPDWRHYHYCRDCGRRAPSRCDCETPRENEVACDACKYC